MPRRTGGPILGPTFFCCSKTAVTRRRSKLWWCISHQSKALDVSYLSSLSKRDLKHSGTFFENLHATLDSQLMKYFAQKASAGRLSDLRNVNTNVSWYLFRLWYMQSEAFRYYKSVEHSPKPSKHQKHTVFNDSNVQKMSFSKKCRTSILTGATIRKQIRWIQICNPFWLKPSKMMSF